MAYINYNLQAVGESQLIIMQKSAMTRPPMHARPSVAAPQFSHFFSQEIIENCAILTSGKQSICPTPPTPPPPPPSTFPPQLTRRTTLPHTHTHACTLCHAYSAPIRIIFPFSVFFSTFFCGISLASANALARGKKKKNNHMWVRLLLSWLLCANCKISRLQNKEQHCEKMLATCWLTQSKKKTLFFYHCWHFLKIPKI